jgi:hypothetical protein
LPWAGSDGGDFSQFFFIHYIGIDGYQKNAIFFLAGRLYPLQPVYCSVNAVGQSDLIKTIDKYDRSRGPVQEIKDD